MNILLHIFDLSFLHNLLQHVGVCMGKQHQHVKWQQLYKRHTAGW